LSKTEHVLFRPTKVDFSADKIVLIWHDTRQIFVG